MREIIYVQAGNLSNHIGTHFWNTQESYFTFEDDKNNGGARGQSSTSGTDDIEVEVNHDISFREGLSNQGEPTYCPRVIVFDHRSNYGALGRHNDLYPDAQGEGEEIPLWNGSILDVRQGEIEKSSYQKRMEQVEEEGREGVGAGADDDDYEGRATGAEGMRYWSDFNRVYYIPRSLQQVSDLPEWEASKGDWNYGKSVYERYDLDNSVRDECLRKFAEECDGLQGFQITFDNNTFGSFSAAFLEHVRDDFEKVSILAFPILSGIKPNPKGVDDRKERVATLQDAACLGFMNELECQAVPIQHPHSWTKGPWSEGSILNFRSPYHTSAMLSAHIENVTSPLRIKPPSKSGRDSSDPLDLASFIDRLNWSQSAPFSHLRGVLPLPLNPEREATEPPLYDFSLSEELRKNNTSVDHSLAVWRGFTSHVSNVQTTISIPLGREPLNFAMTRGYPYISSFPRIIPPSSTISTPNPGLPTSNIRTTKSFRALSALSATPSTGESLKVYADVMKKCIGRKLGVADAAGFEGGELAELEETLRYIGDRYEEAWS